MYALLKSLVASMNDFWKNLIRTTAPVVVTTVAGWLTYANINLDDHGRQALAGIVAALAGIVWQAVALALDRLGKRYGLPALEAVGGFMLILPGSPTYTTPDGTAEPRAPPSP